MANEKSNKPELFIDNERYQWPKTTITGAEILALASAPDGVELYQQVPGKPDIQIRPQTVVDLTQHPGPERFSTQAAGSQAG